MLVAPPAADPDLERARAAVAADAEAVYDETRRKVDDEIARMDAAKEWAIAEMDRLTARAKGDIDAGGDPEAIRARLESELAATIEQASAPEFDPRPRAAVEKAVPVEPAPKHAPTPPDPPPQRVSDPSPQPSATAPTPASASAIATPPPAHDAATAGPSCTCSIGTPAANPVGFGLLCLAALHRGRRRPLRHRPHRPTSGATESRAPPRPAPAEPAATGVLRLRLGGVPAPAEHGEAP